MNLKYECTEGGRKVLNGSEGAQREEELILGLFRKVPTGPRGGRRDREAERRVRVCETKEQQKKKEGRGGDCKHWQTEEFQSCTRKKKILICLTVMTINSGINK